MQRYQSIDIFRGFAILGMVFFSVILRISRDLPDLLRHNAKGSVHLGDFILPMFLFASGLSLAFFLHKNKRDKPKKFFKIVSERFFKLALVGISLSIFSANGFLEMDEVMLSALIFIMSVIISKLNWKILLGIIFVINLSYFALIYFNQIIIFDGHYLGGYPVALYYLPVMLAGLILGRGIINKSLFSKENQIIIGIIFIYFVLFSVFIPLDKMTATPSFIMLSILFSFIIFAIIDKFIFYFSRFKEIEKLGKKPLRYWLLMFIVFIIPFWFYVDVFEKSNFVDITWFFAVIISVIVMMIMFLLSYIIEYFTLSD